MRWYHQTFRQNHRSGGFVVSTMLSVEECKKYLEGVDIPDEKVEEIRDALYGCIEVLLENICSEK